MLLKDFERSPGIVKTVTEKFRDFLQTWRRADELVEKVRVQNARFVTEPQADFQGLSCLCIPELAFSTVKSIFPLCGSLLQNAPDWGQKPTK